MECRITSIKPVSLTRGFALVEATIAAGITAIIVVMVCGFCVFSAHSFAGMYNYADLETVNRLGVDRITRDIRQANRVKSATTNLSTGKITAITLEDASNQEIQYVYNSTQRVLTRKRGTEPSQVILEACDELSFTLGQRTPVGGSPDVYPAASPANCKVVNVSWRCSRTIRGKKENTDSMQTARIVIRKQGT